MTYDKKSDLHISKEMAAATDDVDTLCYWYEVLDERRVEMSAYFQAFREAGVNDEEWTRRAGGAMAFTKMGLTWVERRLLELGETPPYPPTDPRAREVRAMETKIKELRSLLKENGIKIAA